METTEIKDKISEISPRWAASFQRADHSERDGWVLTFSGAYTNKEQDALKQSMSDLLQGPVELLVKSGEPKPIEKSKTAFGSDLSKRRIPGVKKVICVASGKGGVGKSTVSVNLALSLRNQGLSVGIVDADLYGPSIPKMLGCEGVTPEVRGNMLLPVEAFGLQMISFAAMDQNDSALIWRGPMIAKALTQFFYQVEWSDLDVLVIDLPPGTGDIQLTMIEKVPVFGAVVVSSPQDLAMIDATKAVKMFSKLQIDVLGIVENMSGFTCSGCGKIHDIFGRGGARNYAEAHNLRFLGEVPLDLKYRSAGDQGLPVSWDSQNPAAAPFVQMAEILTPEILGENAVRH